MTYRIPKRFFVRGILPGALILLSACSILPTPDPVSVYRLPTAIDPAGSAPVTSLLWSLRVKRPDSGTQFVGRRIAVIPSDNIVSVYKGASWTDPPPAMLRDRFVDAFRADGRLASISSDERGLQADFELDSDLRAFQSEYRDGMPEVVVRVDARLVRTSSQRILASRRFELRERTAGTAIPEVVEAFGSATDKLARELVQWTIEQGVAAEPPLPAP